MTESPATAGDAPDPLDATRRWVERAVIGLNLCPFAKGVHVKGQVHCAVALTDDPAAVLELLREELLALQGMPAEVRDTTLLVLPHCLQDFLDFNDFLGEAEDLLDVLGLDPEQQPQVINWVGNLELDCQAPDMGPHLLPWSDYFDEGLEWWGVWCLTVWNPVRRTLSVLAASATD